MNSNELTHDHTNLCASVREAGELSLRYFRSKPKSWEKQPGDPVSEADIAIDELLRKRLYRDDGSDGWLSEESIDDSKRLTARRVWIVDPIDGTRPFLLGRPEFTICAGLTIDGRPSLAAVFNPATGEFFDAVIGGGARCNGNAIRVSTCSKLEGSRISCNQETFSQYMSDQKLQKIELIKLGSIAYRLAMVASGRHDACVSLHGKNDWDMAAAELLVTEAGGHVTMPDGELIRYNSSTPYHPGVIAAGPKLHESLISTFLTL